MKRARVYVCVDVEVNGDSALPQAITSVSSWIAQSRLNVVNGLGRLEIVHANIYEVATTDAPPHPKFGNS